MNGEWYQARLRWALMADEEGLRHWQESVVLFRSADPGDAFQRALAIGRRREGGGEEAGRFVGLRFTEVVTLDRIGETIPDGWELISECHPATARMMDGDPFAPEQRIPAASF
jgi:hypothetical protein